MFRTFVHNKIASLITTLMVVGLLCGTSVTTAQTNFNQQINYQGKLTGTTGAAVADGTYNMRFWLLTSPSIATTSALWTESYTGSSRVEVQNGLFSVMLGSSSPLTSVNFNQTLYLGVEIGSTTTVPAWDGEMSPRKVLGAVPAAFEAKNAQTVGGVASSSFLRNDAPGTLATTTSQTLFTITQNGTGDIFNVFDTSTEVFTILDGGNVGIGSSSPSATLTVAGTFLASGTSTLATTTLASTTVSSLTLNSDFISDFTGTGLIVSGGALTVSTSSLTGLDATTFNGQGPSYYLARGNHTGTQATSTITGVFDAGNGGTGLSTITQNQLLIGGAGNTWTQVATSSLGLSTAFTTSAQLAALLSDETGAAGGGLVVFSNGPTFTGTTNFANSAHSGTLAVTGTSTLATTTLASTTVSSLTLNSDFINDFTGSLLSVTGGVLNVATTSLGTNLTLTNPAITGGTINNTIIGATTPTTAVFTNATATNATTTQLAVSALTSGRVIFSTTGGRLTDQSTFAFDGSTLTAPNLSLTGTLAALATSTLATTTIASSTIGTLNLTNALAIINGGTGATTAAGARTNLGATTVGANIFTLTDPSALTLIRINADNTVSAVATSTLGIALSDTTGTLAATRGGTGLSTITQNQLLIGGAGNTWTQVATSSLGLRESLFTDGGASTYLTSLTDALAIGSTTAHSNTMFDVWGGLRVGASSTPALYASSTNSVFVGVGATSPVGTEALRVVGNVAIGGGYISHDGDSASGLSIDTAGRVRHTSLSGAETQFWLRNDSTGGSSSMSIVFEAGTAGTDVSKIESRLNGGTSNTHLTFETSLSGTMSEKVRITDTGNFGIGTSTPVAKLGVNGGAYIAGGITATGTLAIAGTSTLATTTVTDLSISAALRDTLGSAGTDGYVLLTSGTSTRWVATSTLGLGSTFGTTINANELASEDFGSFTCNGTTCTIDNNALTASMMGNSDHGFFSYSSNVASLDANGLSSNDLLSAVSNETGTGNLVFSNAPAFGGVASFNAASTTNISATGTANFATTTANNLTLTTALAPTSGGTGLNTYSTGDIIYASGANTLARLTAGGEGTVLKISGGIPSWGTDIANSGAGAWATSSNGLFIYPADPNDVVVVGGSATTTTGFMLEVIGNALVSGIRATTATTTNLVVNNERFTDLTGDGLVLNGTALDVDCSVLQGLGITCTTNNFALDFTEFTTDDIVEGSTNFWGRWQDNFGKLSYAPAGTPFVGVGDTDADYTFEVASSTATGYFAVSSSADNDGDVFEIDPSGNVGIADNTPGYKLDVNGTFRTTGVATFNSGIAASGTSTLATTTLASTTVSSLTLNSDFISDFTGTGLIVSGGALTVSTSSLAGLDATTFNGQGPSYYLARGNHTGTQGTSTITGVFDAGNGGTGLSTITQNQLLIGGAGNTWTQIATSSLGLRESLFTDGGASTYLTSLTDNLSIGSSTANAKLDVWGNLRVGTSSNPVLYVDTTMQQVMLGTTTPFASTGRLYLENYPLSFRNTSALSQDASFAMDTSGLLNLHTTTNGGFIVNNNGNEMMRIVTTGAIFNLNNQSAQDFRIESNTDNSMFNVDSSADSIGISDLVPDATFEISASGNTTGALLYLSSNDDLDGDLLTVLKTGNIGIGTTSPNSKLTVAGTFLASGTSTLATTTIASSTIGTLNLTNALAIINGGTGATTAAGARTNLGATTVGANIFTLTDPSALTLIRINADNTVSAVATSTLGIALSDTTGTLAATRGGTGLSTITQNQLLIGGAGNTWTQVATSSLGLRESLFTDGGASTYLTSLTDNLSIGSSTANAKLDVWGDFRVGTSTTPLFFVSNRTGSPYIGIGTSTPLRNFELYSSLAGEASMRIDEPAPRFEWRENDEAANNRNWRMQASGGVWSLAVQNDALSTTNTVFSVSRSNATPVAFFTEDIRFGINDNDPDFRLEAAGSNTSGYFAISSAQGLDGDVFRVNPDRSVMVGTTTSIGFVTIATSTASSALAIRQYGAGNLFDVYDANTSAFTILDGGNVGIGSTSPNSKLTVAGTFLASGTSTLATTTVTDFALAAAFRDTTNSAGTNGMVLQSTGTSTRWVATSTLGLGGGGATTFLALTDTPSSYTANRIMFTNSGATALTDSANFTYDGNNLGLGGSNGIAFGGNRVLYASTTKENYFFGYQAGENVTTGSGLIAIGWQALMSATSTSNNIAIGKESGISTNSGSDNVFIGPWAAGSGNTTGSRNVYIGQLAGSGATSSVGNTYIGYGAGQESRTLSYGGNSMYGAYAGFNLSSDYSVLIGHGSAFGNGGAYTANRLTTLGYDTGYNLQTGADNNILIGYSAGSDLTTGANNLLIGYDVEAPSNTGSNQLNIGNIIFGTSIDETGTTISDGNIGIGTTSPNSKLTVAGTFLASGTSTLATTTIASSTIGTLNLTNALTAGSGGTGLSTITQNQLLIGGAGNTWSQVATSSLGLSAAFTTLTQLDTILTDVSGITGTGSFVLSASPTFTGTANFANLIGTNATLTSATTTNLAISSLTSGRVPFVTTGGRLTDSANFTFDGTNLGLGNTQGIAWGGTQTLFASTTKNNYFFGQYAGSGVTTGSNLIAIGYQALLNATSTSDNIAIGREAGINTTSGTSNVFIGAAFTGYNNTTGSNNVFIGQLAGGNNISGNYNTFVGNGTNNSLVSGSDNTSQGAFTGFNLATSSRSTLVGYAAAFGNGGAYEASNLTILGRQAGYNLQTGANNNILIGYNAADSLTTGANNLIIGYDVEAPSNTGSNQLNIGNIIFGTSINETGTTISDGNIGIGSSSPNSKLTVAGTFLASGTSTLATTTIASSTIGTLNLTNALTAGNGGTGLSTITQNQLLIGGAGNTWSQVATSSLGLAGTSDLANYLPLTGGTLSGNLSFSGTSANIALGSNWLSGDGGDEGIAVDTTGRAFINSTTPYSTNDLLTITNQGGYTAMSINAHGSVSYEGAALAARRGRGTIASPTVVQNGDLIFQLNAVARGNSAWNGIADFTIDVDGAVSGNNIPSRFTFFTTNSSGVQSEVMRLNSAGNLAIGTSSPNQALSIFRSAADAAIEFSTVSGANEKWTIGIDDSDSAKFKISSSSTLGTNDRFVINGKGNVGIGTSSPNERLTVFSNAGSSADAAAIQHSTNNSGGVAGVSTLSLTNLSQAANTWSRLGFSDEDNTAGASIASGVYGFFTDHTNNYGDLGFITRSASGLTEKMRILSTGNVGIGTSSPASTLDVWGDFRVGTSSTPTLYATTSSGRVGIGTTTPQARLSIGLSNLVGTGVAGFDRYYSFANTASGTVQYGEQAYVLNSSTATTTLVGGILRLADSTAFGNTIRGFEVQTTQGTNTLGENTALSGFGRTFGVRGTTEGDAGAWFEPAGVFAQTKGTTQGNALRAYSGSITTNELVSFFQDTSTFAGTGLLMNFGNAGGSFSSTTSRFVDFQNAGTSKFVVTAHGTTTIGDGTTNNQAGLQIGYGGLCVDNDGSCAASTTGRISSVSSYTGNSDLAEMYFSSENLVPGEIVVTDGFLSVRRATGAPGEQVLGVISTKPGLLLGYDDSSLIPGQQGFPLALSGRVPIRLSDENGPVAVGDALMLSSIPGVAMKATQSAEIVGYALEAFDGDNAYTAGFVDQFGDDIAAPSFEALNENDDERIDDGCYYGAGGATGEADEVCTPNESAIAAAEAARQRAARRAERNFANEQAALLALLEEEADTVNVAGKTVRVGQVIMFVDRGYHQIAAQTDILNELSSTSTELVLGAEEESDETLWSRVKTLAQGFVDGVLTIAGIKADRVDTEELCVDGVCINADDLRALLESADRPSEGSGTGPTPEPEPEPTPDPEPSPEGGDGAGEGEGGGDDVTPSEEPPQNEEAPPAPEEDPAPEAEPNAEDTTPPEDTNTNNDTVPATTTP